MSTQTKTDQPVLVDIGFDIGIASVGWCVTKVADQSIVLHGVRTFDTVDDPKTSKLENATRREKRSMRRQITRRATLRRDFIKLLITSGLVKDINYSKSDLDSSFVEAFRVKHFENRELKQEIMLRLEADLKKSVHDISLLKDMRVLFPYLLRKKALTTKLSHNELIIVLYWYIHHRGFKYKLVDEKQTDKSKKNASTETTETIVEVKVQPESDSKNKYQQMVKNGTYPVDIQLAYFTENRYIRGELNRLFHIDNYRAEINQILSVQKLDHKFVEKFLELFLRQRSFEEGPGGSKHGDGYAAFTPYGRFYAQQGQKIVRIDNPVTSIWEKTAGRCTVFPKEFRAPKISLTSQIFNFLNDINNSRTTEPSDHELEYEDKIALIKLALTKKDPTLVVLKELARLKGFDGDINYLTGFRINKNKEPLITPLNTFYNINKILKKFNLELTFEDIFHNNHLIEHSIFDELAEIFSKTKLLEKRIEAITKLFEQKPNLVKTKWSKDVIAAVSAITEPFSGTHNYSFKAMYKAIPLQLATNENINVIVSKWSDTAFETQGMNFGSKYLSHKWIDNIPNVSPTVKRALRQTVFVFNDLLKFVDEQKLQIRDVVVEMARAHNNKTEREDETERQKYFENINKEIAEQYKNALQGISEAKRKSAMMRLWLARQQNWLDAYDGSRLGSADEIASNAGKYDIDHIIPESQSFDNSRSNLVITLANNNARKSNQTPFQFLPRDQFERMKKLWRTWYIYEKEDNNRVFADREKFMRLTTEIDFRIPSNQEGFIGRNLVDTQWATKAFLSGLMKFSESSSRKFHTQTVNGRETSRARNRLNTKREKLLRPEGIEERDEKGKKSRIWHGHHAEDAFLATVINHYYREITRNAFLKQRMRVAEILYNKAKIEKSNESKRNEHSISQDVYIAARNELNDKFSQMLFSRMIKNKENTRLFNETLYRAYTKDDKKTGEKRFVKVKTYKLVELDKAECAKLFGDQSTIKKSPVRASEGNEDEDNENEDFSKKGAASLECYHYDRKMYDALRKVYNENSNEKLPFAAAMRAIAKDYIPVFSKDNKTFRTVRTIRARGEEKKETQIIRAPHNGNSFYDSFDWIELEIYKTRDNRLAIIPVSAFTYLFTKEYVETDNGWNVKTMRTPKVENIAKLKTEKNIDLSEKPYMNIVKGDLIAKHKEDGSFDLANAVYVVGANLRHEQLELKYVFRGKIDNEQKQNLYTINKGLSKSFLLKKCDFIGKNCEFFKSF